jgi:hypothetical protein
VSTGKDQGDHFDHVLRRRARRLLERAGLFEIRRLVNREAERFVALSAKEKDAVRFLVVDLDHPCRDQKALVSRFYRSYIPTLAFLDASGKVVYNRSGETVARRGDTSGLEEILRKASPAR